MARQMADALEHAWASFLPNLAPMVPTGIAALSLVLAGRLIAYAARTVARVGVQPGLRPLPGQLVLRTVGDRKGRHSIRVDQQYGITFRWERHDAYDVCREDYH